MATQRRIKVNESGKVTVVTFNDSKIIDEAEIQEFGQELYDLVEREGTKEDRPQFRQRRVPFQRRAGQADRLRQARQAARGRADACRIFVRRFTKSSPSRN